MSDDGLEIVDPPTLAAPRGYANGVVVPAGRRLLLVAGQVAWNEGAEIVSEDFATQFGQALANVLEVVRAAGGEAGDVARLTIYVTDRTLYTAQLAAVGAEYRRLMGKHFPAMALVEVAALLEPGALVEIEAIAALP